jgi:hypothetical protein
MTTNLPADLFVIRRIIQHVDSIVYDTMLILLVMRKNERVLLNHFQNEDRCFFFWYLTKTMNYMHNVVEKNKLLY